MATEFGPSEQVEVDSLSVRKMRWWPEPDGGGGCDDCDDDDYCDADDTVLDSSNDDGGSEYPSEDYCVISLLIPVVCHCFCGPQCNVILDFPVHFGHAAEI